MGVDADGGSTLKGRIAGRETRRRRGTQKRLFGRDGAGESEAVGGLLGAGRSGKVP